MPDFRFYVFNIHLIPKGLERYIHKKEWTDLKLFSNMESALSRSENIFRMNRKLSRYVNKFFLVTSIFVYFIENF